MKAVGFEGDVRKQEDAKRVVESTFKHFGWLDILVNAAAGNFLVSAEDLSPNGFRTGCLLHLRFLVSNSHLNIFYSLGFSLSFLQISTLWNRNENDVYFKKKKRNKNDVGI